MELTILRDYSIGHNVCQQLKNDVTQFIEDTRYNVNKDRFVWLLIAYLIKSYYKIIIKIRNYITQNKLNWMTSLAIKLHGDPKY